MEIGLRPGADVTDQRPNRFQVRLFMGVMGEGQMRSTVCIWHDSIGKEPKSHVRLRRECRRLQSCQGTGNFDPIRKSKDAPK